MKMVCADRETLAAKMVWEGFEGSAFTPMTTQILTGRGRILPFSCTLAVPWKRTSRVLPGTDDGDELAAHRATSEGASQMYRPEESVV